MFHLPVEPVQPLNGVGREQKLTGPRASLDALDPDLGVGQRPLCNGAIGNLASTRDLVVWWHFDTIEDLLQIQCAPASNKICAAVGSSAEIKRLHSALPSPKARCAHYTLISAEIFDGLGCVRQEAAQGCPRA